MDRDRGGNRPAARPGLPLPAVFARPGLDADCEHERRPPGLSTPDPVSRGARARDPPRRDDLPRRVGRHDPIRGLSEFPRCAGAVAARKRPLSLLSLAEDLRARAPSRLHRGFRGGLFRPALPAGVPRTARISPSEKIVTVLVSLASLGALPILGLVLSRWLDLPPLPRSARVAVLSAAGAVLLF